MTVHFVKGDIFKTEAQSIVITVNTVGVMGKGIALGAKLKYPGVMKNYVQRCRSGELVIGKMLTYPIGEDKQLILFPTKITWQKPSKIEWIEQGLEKLASHYKQQGITSLAIPKLGATNGMLEWEIVKQFVFDHMDPLDIDVYVYE